MSRKDKSVLDENGVVEDPQPTPLCIPHPHTRSVNIRPERTSQKETSLNDAHNVHSCELLNTCTHSIVYA